MPMVAEVASEFEAEREVDKLRLEFGGEEQWRETARQIGSSTSQVDWKRSSRGAAMR